MRCPLSLHLPYVLDAVPPSSTRSHPLLLQAALREAASAVARHVSGHASAPGPSYLLETVAC